MDNSFTRGEVVDSLHSGRALAQRLFAILLAIQAAALFTLVHAYHDILLLHFPVKYVATYSARIEDVLTRMEADEAGINPEYTWKLLRRELRRWLYAMLTSGCLLLL